MSLTNERGPDRQERPLPFPERPPEAMPSAPPPPPAPPSVRGAGITLIVLGALSSLANGMFVGMVLSGDLEENLADAGYEVENTGLFAIVTVLGTILGLAAVASGIQVLRMMPSGRVMGIVTASLLALGYVLNLTGGTGNFLTFVLLAFSVSVVWRLGRAGDAFRQPVT